MNNRSASIVHAARGPILLITIGVLFAFHQAGILSFGRTWPLLIIVLGVMKLLERTLTPRPFFGAPRTPYAPYPGQYPPPPPPPPPYQPPPAGGGNF